MFPSPVSHGRYTRLFIRRRAFSYLLGNLLILVCCSLAVDRSRSSAPCIYHSSATTRRITLKRMGSFVSPGFCNDIQSLRGLRLVGIYWLGSLTSTLFSTCPPTSCGFNAWEDRELRGPRRNLNVLLWFGLRLGLSELGLG